MINLQEREVKEKDFEGADGIHSTPQHESISFLKSLYANCQEGCINTRFLPSKKNFFYPLLGLERIQKVVEANTSQDIYFGISTRVDGDGTKAGIRQIPALWVDLDSYKLDDKEKEESQQRLRDFPLGRSFVVGSGKGQYLIWLLKEPASREDIPKVENILKRLCSFFHGDMVAVDASRIFRIPGSINHKYPDEPVATVEEFHPERQSSLDDFDSLLPPLKTDIPIGCPGLPRLGNVFGLDVDELLAMAIKIAQSKEGVRNQTGFILSYWLRDAGLSLEEALSIVLRYADAVRESGDHIYDGGQAMASLKQAYRNGPKDIRPSVDRIIEGMEKENDERYDFSLSQSTSLDRLNSYLLVGKHRYCGQPVKRGDKNVPDCMYIMSVPGYGHGHRGHGKRYCCNSWDCPLCGVMKARALRARILEDMPSPYLTIIPLKKRNYLLGQCREKGLDYYWIVRTSFEEIKENGDEVLLLTTGQLTKDSQKVDLLDGCNTLLNRFLELGHLNGRMKYGCSSSFNMKEQLVKASKVKSEQSISQPISTMAESPPIPIQKEDEEMAKKETYFFVPQSLLPELIDRGCKIEVKGCDGKSSVDKEAIANLDKPLENFEITYSDAVLKKFWAIRDRENNPKKTSPLFSLDDPWNRVRVVHSKNEMRRLKMEEMRS